MARRWRVTSHFYLDEVLGRQAIVASPPQSGKGALLGGGARAMPVVVEVVDENREQGYHRIPVIWSACPWDPIFRRSVVDGDGWSG